MYMIPGSVFLHLRWRLTVIHSIVRMHSHFRHALNITFLKYET
jgi:hypothetical protein